MPQMPDSARLASSQGWERPDLKPPKKGRALKAIFLVVVVLVAIVSCTAMVGSALVESSQPTTSNLPQRKEAIADGVKPKAPAKVTSIGDGTYEVGSDIKAGKYKSKGGDWCYWARLKNDEQGVISNSISPGPQVVTIKSTDYAFETSGCAGWKKVK